MPTTGVLPSFFAGMFDLDLASRFMRVSYLCKWVGLGAQYSTTEPRLTRCQKGSREDPAFDARPTPKNEAWGTETQLPCTAIARAPSACKLCVRGMRRGVRMGMGIFPLFINSLG